MKRRAFFRNATVAAMAATGLPEWFLDSARAAETRKENDIGVALIGCGGQGKGDLDWASKFARVVAVCDVDQKRAEAAAVKYPGVKIYDDFRKLLEDRSVHAVVNGTPDHWHTLINLAACKAGKDVYSEKPLTLTIDEGRRLVKAVREAKRVFQTGSQQRSDAKFRLACELVQNGRIGKLKEVIANLPAGPRRGPFSPAPVPPSLNWDYWQGQTPAIEYVPERCHGSFRYWFEYSGGTMTDWGAHHNDIALWGLDHERSGPASVEGKALVEMIPGGFTTPSEYRVEYIYANGVRHICQSVSNAGPDGRRLAGGAEELGHGVQFIGEKGWIFVTRGKIKASNDELITTPLGSDAEKLYASNSHMGNFFECIQSRKAPICEAEIGHRSVSVCHLGVIAIRLGRKLKWEPAKEEFVGDAEANRMIARPMRKPYDYGFVA